MDQHEPDDTSPIEHELEVAVSRTRAWDAYVHGLSEWWHPGWTATGSGLDRIEVEQRDGLRIVEHGRDGREVVWGEVIETIPGERFGHTFRLTHEGDATTVLAGLSEHFDPENPDQWSYLNGARGMVMAQLRRMEIGPPDPPKRPPPRVRRRPQ